MFTSLYMNCRIFNRKKMDKIKLIREFSREFINNNNKFTRCVSIQLKEKKKWNQVNEMIKNEFSLNVHT